MSRDTLRLLHIRDAIRRIRSYVTDRSQLDEPLIQDAVVRNLEIIGEAVKALSDETRRSEPSSRAGVPVSAGPHFERSPKRLRESLAQIRALEPTSRLSWSGI